MEIGEVVEAKCNGSNEYKKGKITGKTLDVNVYSYEITLESEAGDGGVRIYKGVKQEMVRFHFDPTTLCHVGAFASTGLPLSQLKSCLNVIIWFYDVEKKSKSPSNTKLYHSIAQYNPTPHMWCFSSRIDFHHKLLKTYHCWRRLVQQEHKLLRQKRFKTIQIIPKEISTGDFWVCCRGMAKYMKDNGPTFQKIKAKRMVPGHVMQELNGCDPSRRALWIYKWQCAGKTIVNNGYGLVVLPLPIENLFYRVICHDMIVRKEDSRDFQMDRFVSKTMTQPYAIEAKGYLVKLFEGKGDVAFKFEVDAVKHMMESMIKSAANTVLKRTAEYNNAKDQKKAKINLRAKLASNHDEARRKSDLRDKQKKNIKKETRKRKKPLSKRGRRGSGRGGGRGGGRGSGRRSGGSGGGRGGGRGRGRGSGNKHKRGKR